MIAYPSSCATSALPAATSDTFDPAVYNVSPTPSKTVDHFGIHSLTCISSVAKGSLNARHEALARTVLKLMQAAGWTAEMRKTGFFMNGPGSATNLNPADVIAYDQKLMTDVTVGHPVERPALHIVT